MSESNRISRRTALGLLGGVMVAPGCRKTSLPQRMAGEILGNHAPIGHRLWATPPTPTRTVSRNIVIVGGGVAGLSAAWRLKAAGVTDVEVLELAPDVGGTSRGGRNSVSAYPFGAHYLPVPNPETVLVQRLCREMGLMSGSETSPRFDSRHLVFAPEDRLFFRGRWYPGLFLTAGASPDDHAQHARFDAAMGTFRELVGSDSKHWFAIPSSQCSRDTAALALDNLTMADWMAAEGFTSSRVRWFVDYACRDDYGADATQVSAWSGIHYFAGRRPMRSPQTEGTHYFTWPEGNARLIAHLRGSAGRITPNQVVLRANEDGTLIALDTQSNDAIRYSAQHVILATPNHVTARLVPERARFGAHAPWLVANITLSQVPGSAPDGWNNVMYESASQGFIDARHQSFGPATSDAGATVWTWYRALPLSEKRHLLTADWTTLSSEVIADLRAALGDIRPFIERLDLWRWGHGTIIPKVGLQSSGALARARQPHGRLHFAHTDLGGLPLFEEAQDHGVRAAEEVLASRGATDASWRKTTN